MFSHDIIKLKYSQEGYLPNWPYHLISDEEMCEAFLTYPWYDYRTDEEKRLGTVLTDDESWNRFINGTELCYFRDNYPLYRTTSCEIPEKLIDEAKYKKLVEALAYHIEEFKTSNYDNTVLPDWVYSYMLGSTCGVHTNQLDMHYLLVMLDTDNTFDEFTPEAAEACYRVSEDWLKRSSELEHRPPTMFGEPHVIKSLRLQQVSL